MRFNGECGTMDGRDPALQKIVQMKLPSHCIIPVALHNPTGRIHSRPDGHPTPHILENFNSPRSIYRDEPRSTMLLSVPKPAAEALKVSSE